MGNFSRCPEVKTVGAVLYRGLADLLDIPLGGIGNSRKALNKRRF
jgi:hypothetical protein